MEQSVQHTSGDYSIRVEKLDGRISAFRDETLLASSDNAKVMYETRLAPTIYFPSDDVHFDLNQTNDLRTFCPFKGTAHYGDIVGNDATFENA